jgi:predicted DNA-binding transcriptional regulator AlpA
MAHSYDFEDVPVQTSSPVSPREVTKNLAPNALSLSKMEVNLFPNQYSFPQTGFVRLSSILAPLGPIPVSKSTWWAGVKSGRYPRPVKLGPRITAWRVEDIIGLLNGSGKLSSGERA